MLDSPDKGSSRDKGQSFLRVLRILEAVVDADKAMGAAEISTATEIPRPSVVRLCALLEREGLLRREIDGRRYVSGWRLWRFGFEIVASATNRAERDVILEQVVQDVGETCNIVVPDRTMMVIADRIESNWAVRAHLDVGTRVPFHSSATGKLFLSYLAPARRKRLLDKLDLERNALNTITDRQALEKELRRIRKAGYSLDDQELLDGMVAAAVPILDAKGRFCAAMSVQGAVSRFPVEMAESHIPTMQAAVKQLEALLDP